MFRATEARRPGFHRQRIHNSLPATLCDADKCWAEADLEPVRLHDAHHTFASYLVAAGVNAKAIQTYMGHSSIQVTYDIYGHLFPGNEAEAAALLDDYLTGGSPNRSPSRVRAA